MTAIDADRWLIERVVEPVSHHIEHATGITNWTVARFVLVVYAAVDIAKALSEHTAWTYAIAAITLIVCFLRFFSIGHLEAAKKANWERLMPLFAYLRLAGVALVLVSLPLAPLVSNWMFVFGFGSYVASLYFAVCSQPPPKPKRHPVFALAAMEPSA